MLQLCKFNKIHWTNDLILIALSFFSKHDKTGSKKQRREIVWPQESLTDGKRSIPNISQLLDSDGVEQEAVFLSGSIEFRDEHVASSCFSYDREAAGM